MSTNITAFKVNEVALTLPADFDWLLWVASLPDKRTRTSGYTSDNRGKQWQLERPSRLVVERSRVVGGGWNREPRRVIELDPAEWRIDLAEQSLRGIVFPNGTFVLGQIDWRGEGSGTTYGDLLLPLFQSFDGTLDVVVAWEGGDIEHLIIRGGVMEQEV